MTSSSHENSNPPEEIISTFSNKRLMKLLYLLCLESVPSDYSSVGLFDVFDNMIAYPNGPVEQDIYDGLGLITGVKYENGRIVDLKDCGNINVSDFISQQIDDALKNLVDRIGLSKFTDTEYLINVVHSLYLWPKIYVSSSDSKSMRFSKDNIQELKNEVKVYKEFFLNKINLEKSI